MITTADLLAPLLSTISAVRDGSQQVAPGRPVRIHLVPPSIDLEVPALMLAVAPSGTDQLPDLNGYLSDATKVVGGQPIPQVDLGITGPPLKGAALPVSVVANDPTDIGTLPSLETASATAANALSGVPGLIAQLVGAVPIPVMAPVQLSVTWRVQRDGQDVASSQDTWQLIGSGPDVQFVFAQVFAELTSAGPTIAHFEVIASVTLSVGSDSVGPTDLPPVPVDVPAIGIPTIGALFNTSQFGGANPGTDDDKAVMLLVPSNSPIKDQTSLNQAIQTVTTAVNGVTASPLTTASLAAQLALFLTGLGRVGSALSGYVGGAAKWPIQVVTGDANDGVGDLSSVPYDDELLPGDDFDDEVYSAILVAVPNVHLLLATDDDYKGTKLTISTGPEMVIAVPSFDQGQLGNVIPAGVTGSAVVNHGGDSEDVEDGNFESARFIRD
jgi:hypothetical protein